MASLSEIAAGYLAVRAPLGDLQGDMARVKSFFTSQIGSLQKVASISLAGLGAGLLGSIAGGFGAGKAAADFEQAMADAATAFDIFDRRGDGTFKKLEEAAINFGKATKFSSKEAAEGLQVFGQAGLKAEDAIAALGPALASAAANNVRVADAAELAVSVMSGMGMTAKDLSHVNDSLTIAAARSSATFGDMTTALRYIVPVARQSKTSLEDLLGMVSLLAQSGIKGEVAGSGIRGIISDLSSPTAKARAELDKLGISTKELGVKDGALLEILRKLQKAHIGLAQATSLVGVQQATQLLSLLNTLDPGSGQQGVAAIESFANAMRDVANTGITEKKAAGLMDTFKGAFEKMVGELEASAIALGTPLMNVFRPAVEGMESLFGELPSTLKPVVDLIANRLGSAISGVSGFLRENGDTFKQWVLLYSEYIGNLSAGFMQLGGLLGQTLGNAGVWTTIKNGITGVLNAMSLLTTDFGKTWELIKIGAEVAWFSILDLITLRVPAELRASWAGVTAAFQVGWKETVAFIDANSGGMASRVIATVQGMAAAFAAFAQSVAEKFSTLAAFIPGVFGHIGQALAARLAQLGDNPNIKAAFDQAKAAAGAMANEPARQLDVAQKMAVAAKEAHDAAMRGVPLEGERARAAKEAFAAKVKEINAQRELNRLVAENKQQIIGQVGAIGLGAMPGMGGLGALAGIAAMQPGAAGPAAGPQGNKIKETLAAIAAAKRAVQEGAKDGTKEGQHIGFKELHKQIQESIMKENTVAEEQLEVQQNMLKHLEEKLAKQIAEAMPRGIFGRFGL